MTDSQIEILSIQIYQDVKFEKEKFDVLTKSCTENAEFYARDESENGQRLYICFLALRDVCEAMWPKLSLIQENVQFFDFDENTPGNGYRSFLFVIHKALEIAASLSQRVCSKRAGLLFRKTQMARDVESCSHLLASLNTILTHLVTLLSWSTKGSLFPNEEHSPQELMSKCDDINQYCFYGRYLGFQFLDSVRNILHYISLSMAIFSELYYGEGSFLSKTASQVLNTTKYVTDPEQRAKRIVNVTRIADVDFCKKFWFLSESELLNNVPSVVSPTVAVCKVINLPLEPMTITVNGREIDVPVPSSYIESKTLPVRLIIHNTKNGTQFKGMVLHCHGGGFVSHTSKSHESYLKDWAKMLKVPILSVDYSLAPECPYPRALEEVLYAYCWAKKNYKTLGSTSDKIIAAGDSAGGNLLLAATLKCLSMGIPAPDGIFAAYVPTLVNFIPSPARLLCMMDPLLPFGFLMRCLKAYAHTEVINGVGIIGNDGSIGESSTCSNSFEEVSASDLADLQAHKSAVSEPSDTLSYVYDFMDALDSDVEVTELPKPQEKPSSSSSTTDFSVHSKLSMFVSDLRAKIGAFIGQNTHSYPDKLCEETNMEKNLIDEFKFEVPKDPFISPYYASDEQLKRFPPVRIMTVHMDPCLDDCVMFSKRLKELGVDVKFEILNGLPHGFLNLSMISKEAHQASVLCAEKIEELLKLDLEDK